jgi:hypothetical protein
MRNKILLLALAVFLALPLVAAVSPVAYYQTCSHADITLGCKNQSGYFCTNDTIVTANILFPNQSLYLGNTSFSTNDGFTFNKTLEPPATCVEGDWSYLAYGVGNNTATSEVHFQINPTGKAPTSVLDNQFLIILGVMAFALLVLGVTMNNAYMGFSSGILFFLLGVYTMIYGFAGITDLYTRGLATVFIGMGLFFSFSAAYEWALWGGNE